ncbi:hypothetical protein H9P43_006256 [Blastocladiella emersonii ATCC 22665]|nr:hypothetical protein H9P43_006256 [Blastocladiella emersonii ATCC 22665]
MSSYLDRLNARPVTLEQLAPHMVVTTACYINAAITTHLGVSTSNLPPLLDLYAALLEALKDKHGPLGLRLAKRCRELIHNSNVKARAKDVAVQREALSGIPIAAFLGSDNEEE